MNNWYRILRPFDSFTRQDVGRPVAFPGDIRHLGLEQLGYLENLGPVAEEVPPDVVKKRGRRGKQVEAGPPEVEAVREVPGGELRGPDLPSD